MIKLLLVEDEKRMAQALCEILRQENKVEGLDCGADDYLEMEAGRMAA